ncbi:hypothetical protein DCAR_0208752 [Daucus carota subsp. sativus]|uniref:Iron-sulfur cluster biosynthesis family protein n=1 Tax=Daucus carota subsp. sativus TaxID=79200 RepID=A0AAF0WI12_DAUCS|nr:PREDICTED: uncharacterized protein At5g03900, chloroplastic-like [Daucus carota subsp. sativus]WOG89514.1 hypothetical protein DCAR_0208752 [Daucus carota subsp. sativus]
MASLASCSMITSHKSRAIMLTLNSSSISSLKPTQFNYFQSQSSLFLRNKSNLEINSRSASRSVIRAKIDVSPLSIRPGGIIETDKLPSDVRKMTMDAVDACGGRVTVGDVASKAGIKLDQAQKALQALAADADGFLEVSDDGDVLYAFPKNYRSKLATKSLRIKFEPLLEKAKSGAEYVVRVSFGTALIASIVIVYTTIIAILSSKSDEDNRGRRGRSYNSGFNLFLSPTDLFWYWDPYYYRRRRVRAENNGMNYIESVFSFVFGDGDPNTGIEEERWKLMGEYIASNGGVIAAEELAPYLDVEQRKDMNDESYILPVLLRFDGRPEIDDEGNILYRFPSLQITASRKGGRKEYVGRKWADWVGGVERYFREQQWQFSKTSSSETAMVVGLGGLNLFGVVILGTMLKNMTVVPSGFITFVSNIFPLLQIYAASFFAIPLVRWLLVQKKNAEIRKRNQAREQRYLALQQPDMALRRKLISARDMASRTVISKDRIVYSTERDLFEQDYEATEWDKRFQELENSE